MRHSKKGDLAISTNAIVILIIAVIMLGLIIAFVTRAVGTAGDALLQRASSLPDPIPTASQPLAVTENILTDVDKEFLFKIAAYNPTTTEQDITFIAKCSAGSDVTLTTVDLKKVPAKKTGVSAGSGSFNDQGLKLCQITAIIDSQTYSRPFTVEVRK